MTPKKSGSAPKFSSFQPQPPIAIASDRTGSGQRFQPSLPEAQPAGDKSHKITSFEARRNDQNKKPAKSLGRSTSGHHQSPSSNEAFALDLKGDANNTRYGSMDRYTISKYRRSGAGSVMGVPKWQKIDRGREHSNIIELNTANYNQSIRGIRSVHPQRDVLELTVKPSVSSDTSIGANDDFIAISESQLKKRKRSPQDGNTTESNESDEASSGPFYHSNKETHKAIDSNRHRTSEDQDPEVTLAHPKAPPPNSSDLLIMELRQRLHENPADAELWLEFASVSNQNQATLSARRDAELRMSILDEALKKVKDASGYEKLLLAYMKAAEIALDNEQALRKWEDMALKNRQLTSLQIHYLHFRQTNFATFRLNDYRDSAALVTVSNFNKMEADKTDAIEQPALAFDLLLQITVCFREAGFQELANAIWQINLEVNFLQELPDEPLGSQNRASKLAELQNFWESDLQRIGEVAKPDENHETTLKLHSSEINYSSVSDVKTWASIEIQSSRTCELSARVSKDSDEIDPFRVVLFSDIRSAIIYATSETDRQQLINAFLRYSHFPAIPFSSSLNNGFMDIANSEGIIVSNLYSASTDPHILRQLTNDYQLDETLLFADGSSWFSPFSHTAHWKDWSPWCRCALRRIVDIGKGSESLIEYLLGWEIQSEPSTARKIAKKALKRHSSSLRLYNAFAHIEARTGKEGVAERVLKTVLESNPYHADTTILQRTWIWLLIDAGNLDRALAKLLEFSLGVVLDSMERQANAATVLRARKAILNETDRLLAKGDYEKATHQIEIGVLLEYLSSSFPLASALSSFETLKSRLPPKVHNTRPDELLHQFRARLVYKHHHIGGDLSSIKLRDVLIQSIKEFPQNSLFPSLLDHIDPWVGVNDRLSTIISDIRDPLQLAAQKQNSPDQFLTPHLYALRSEIRRHTEGKSTVHAIRSRFERAIVSVRGAHCPTLWRWYCIFECESGDPKLARQVFYRAIRACPWVKDLYMMAFDELAAAMSTDDLHGVYELVEDKELRIRVPLDQSVVKE